MTFNLVEPEPRRKILYFLVFLFLLGACQKNVQSPSLTLPEAVPSLEFVREVVPAPNSVISLGYFESQQQKICVDFSGRPLLEFGDVGLETEDFLARSLLLVDGKEWRGTEAEMVADLLMTGSTYYKYDSSIGSLLADPETGKYFGGVNGVGPFFTCWLPVHLDMGMHSIEFQSTKTSGEKLTYNWNFRIVK